MNRLLLLFAFLTVTVTGWAQSAYISYSAYDQGERIGNLDGAGGILIVSARNDLVITVTNDASAQVSAPEQRQDGMYEYAVVVDRNVTKEPNIEVNRRGDVNRVGWVVITKPDFFRSYLIEEVQKPIRIENQTKSNDAGQDKSKAEVEFQSTINDLTISCPELVACGATITKSKKRGDNSINIISVNIPIDILNTARTKLETIHLEHEAMRKKLLGEEENKKATNAEWERLDQLEEDEKQAADYLQRLTQIRVFAQGTNQLPVDISDLRGQSKMVYGVLLLKVVEKIHTSICAGFMDEGGRQFSLRQYEAARNAFISALSAKDTPKELLPTIRTSIAHCDSCIKYEQLTKGALIRIGELKKRDAVAQTDIVNYYGAAADFMRIVNKYNPSDYYSKNINMLETYIENMPLTLKFRFVKWVVDRVSATERGPFPNIEVWACYDTTNPNSADYSSPRKFRKMVRSNAALYKLIGISDELGVVDMEFNRKSLPTGFFFRCASDNVDASIVYKDMKNVMSSSEGEFNKRQFRQKIYLNHYY